ncbi:MAG TPA: glutamate dehydrogenase, partial [Acidimicrobiales bacterium]|nr:glutamate dehydrogenase [Acidimicrobiales bacterium]
EINGKDAANLISSGVVTVTEGANMPTSPDAVELFVSSGILYGPGKAANAGGVAVSGLEMTQDSERLQWTREQVDQKLQSIMRSIHATVSTVAEEYGQPGNYVFGANVASFLRVATAMLDEDVV